jgi:tRNA(Phe) wybutosine-synthesizing methylase Tyw3
MNQTSTTNQTVFNIINTDEFFLDLEDFQKLQMLKENALRSAQRAKDILPPQVRGLIVNIEVGSQLHENAHDQLEIVTTFDLSQHSSPSEFLMVTKQTFRVNCLDEKLENLVSKEFTNKAFSIAKDFHAFLYRSKVEN